MSNGLSGDYHLVGGLSTSSGNYTTTTNGNVTYTFPTYTYPNYTVTLIGPPDITKQLELEKANEDLKRLNQILETAIEGYEMTVSKLEKKLENQKGTIEGLMEEKTPLSEIKFDDIFETMNTEEKFWALESSTKVWQRSTNKGPFITIEQVYGKVADKYNRTFAWLVRDQEGKDLILPIADIVLKEPKLEPKVKGNSSALIYTIIVVSLLFNFFCLTNYIFRNSAIISTLHKQ